jgi:DNA polymerase III epsilon subunit-like protein
VAKKILQVPELMVGFDTETTGLDVTCERAISYGFCEYRFGSLVRSDHYFVIPDRPIAPAARRVHGLSAQDIEARRGSDVVLSVKAGLMRAIAILRDYHELGAHFIGANIVRFDLEMLRRSAQSVLGDPLNSRAFDLSLLRTVDVIEHDLVIDPSRELRPRRGLEYLCSFYGVVPGRHDALGDARATVEVFIEQVIRNNAGQMALELVAPAEEIIDTVRLVDKSSYSERTNPREW